MKKGRYSIDALPELPLEPFELAGKLAHARRGPFLTIVPTEQPTPTPPPPKPLPHVPTPSFEVRKYFTQAIYPRVICIDPGDFANEMVLDANPDEGSGNGGGGRGDLVDRADIAVLAMREEHYKLSTLHGKKLHHALWCTVKYGPWLAVAKETESCITGEPNRWEFFIVEVPEVSMIWYGQWLDQPSLPNLTVIKGDLALAGVSRQCCGGYKWCPTTHSCIPLQVNCQTPVPV
jgi:hypothetical protein